MLNDTTRSHAPLEVDVHAYTICNETRVDDSGELAFETPEAQWSYALQYALPLRPPPPCVVEVTVRVTSGRVGVGCVDGSLSRFATAEVFVDAGSQRVTSPILVEDESAQSLIVRNVCETASSTGTLHGIRIRPVSEYSTAAIKQMRAGRHQYWHYAFDLGDGVVVRETLTGGMETHRLNQRILMSLLESNFDLTATKTCLDAACSSGFHSFALAEKGLAVTAIDIDLPSIEQARFVQSCIPAPRGTVQFRHQDLLAVDETPQFDIVFCSGLFYHLRDLVGGAKKLFDVSRAGAVVHSCVSNAAGDLMELADHRKYCCCFPGEFSFVPTASLLEKIFGYVGFRDVRRYSASELCGDAALSSLEPVYADLMRNHTAYYVVRK